MNEEMQALIKAIGGDTEVQLGASRTGFLERVTDFSIGGINIGKPIAGLAVAGANDVLAGWVQGMVGGIGGRYAAMIPTLIGLWLLNTKRAKGWIGEGAVDAGTIILVADLVTKDLYDIRAKISGLVSGVKLGSINLGAKGQGQGATPGANETAEQYVARIFGS